LHSIGKAELSEIQANNPQDVRTLGIVSVGRSDFSIYLPILRAIQNHPKLELRLIISGTHLSPGQGQTIEEIHDIGFTIYDHVDMLLASSTPEGTVKSMGLGLIGFAQLFSKSCPDLLLVLGDRFEMYTAALAALPFRIPVAHLHGGELTEGAMDDALRHSITKLSHLHFVSTEEYARRVIQLGEEPWRVVVSGAPALENLKGIKYLDLHALVSQFNLFIDPGTHPILVTYHPETLSPVPVQTQLKALFIALENIENAIIFTAPNADQSGYQARESILNFVKEHPRTQFVENFGSAGYFSMMRLAGAMVGNSSSGIIEAASFKLPVVNIGERQKGRIHGKNVIDVGHDSDAILAAIKLAVSQPFRSSLHDLINPYWKENSSDIIIQTLATLPLDQKLLRKNFFDLP
jgi:UDP-hydrolysing UDP-N-acetyl-D-glucosamine 2-epimerase